MKSFTFLAMKLAIAVAISVTFVSILAGIYSYKPIAQLERGE